MNNNQKICDSGTKCYYCGRTEKDLLHEIGERVYIDDIDIRKPYCWLCMDHCQYGATDHIKDEGKKRECVKRARKRNSIFLMENDLATRLSKKEIEKLVEALKVRYE